MSFRSLRVMNEDWIAPGQGFGTHGHEDMEIVTYVLEGALAHRDSLGSGDVLHPGELQRMTAGTGISHSEFNASQTDPVHLYQIWLLPEREGTGAVLRAEGVSAGRAAQSAAAGGIAGWARRLADDPAGRTAFSGLARSGSGA